MGELIKKEIKLAMHPTNPLFLALSTMLLIPNYPYYIIFFYTSLSVFFTCLLGRENKDIYYTMLLPVKKSDIVKARFAFVILMELLQIIIAIPFAYLRQQMNIPNNMVGIEANIALFGFAFLLLGIFNLSFFTTYYKDVQKVGTSFMVSSTVMFIFILVAETLIHAIPFFRDKIDTLDTQFISEKLIILILGIIAYLVLTAIAYKKSIKSFLLLDI